MPLYRVVKGQDAWINYEAFIEASSAEEASEIARERDFRRNGIKWHRCGEAEFDHCEVFPEETRLAEGDELDDTVDPAHRDKNTILVSRAELNTILAALRNWQITVDGPYVPEPLEDIATNGGEHGLMPSEDIDRLCERING